MSVSCRACHSPDLRSFYKVDRIPVHSCLMVDTREQALAFPTGSLDLTFCNRCGFIQNSAYDPHLQSYSTDYEETQAFSPRFLQFVDEICDDQDEKYALGGKTVLEIGCGKGEFLVRLCERTGAQGIGIDPGYRPERTTSEAADRITFIQDFYGPNYVHLQADYVCCRHTLEHIGNVHEFMTLVRQSIGDRPSTIIFFELPDVERVLIEQAFWDIYYEHCTYFTLGSLARLFRQTGFDVHELWKAYDGQYLMLEATPSKGATKPRLGEEDDLAKTVDQVHRFEQLIAEKRDRLSNELKQWKSQGLKVALWGSGSKAVSYLTTLDVAEQIDAVVDINPHKHGKFLAGAGNEIVAPQSLQTIKPDVVLAMNSIYLEEIQRDLKSLGLGDCQLMAL